MLTPGKYPVKLGAIEAITFAPEESSSFRRARSLRIFLAWAGHTLTHSPQATQDWGITLALPPTILIAFTGQCRTHL
jgi:hypothetical protein